MEKSAVERGSGCRNKTPPQQTAVKAMHYAKTVCALWFCTRTNANQGLDF